MEESEKKKQNKKIAIEKSSPFSLLHYLLTLR